MDGEREAPPTYASIYPADAVGSAEGDDTQRTGRIPAPSSYDAPSREGRPRVELVRGAAYTVGAPSPTYVSDAAIQPVAGENPPMVAMPPLSTEWRNTLDGAHGGDKLRPLSFHETSFSSPEPTTYTYTEIDEPNNAPTHDVPKNIAESGSSPVAERPAIGASAVNLDVYNGNESPDHLPAEPAAHSGNIQFKLSREDEQDADNGNAPELEHLRQSAASTGSTPTATQPTTPSRMEACLHMCEACTQRKSTRKLIIILSVVIPCLLMFLLIFPLSFIYVDYYQIALKRTKSTGFVDTQHVYYPGCYVLGPDMEFRYFDMSANFVELNKIQVTTVDRLTFTLTIRFQYYPIAAEVGKLYDMFEVDYDPVIRTVATSTIKNECVKFSFDQFKSNRTYIEKYFHHVLKKRFEGDCEVTESSATSMCNQAYHVDVRYFQLGSFDTPDALMERLMRRSISHELAETEKFKLESAVVEKETMRQVQAVENAAAEILANATAQATYIGMEARAKADVITTMAHVNGLRQMCANLSITQSNHKMSMFYINTIKTSTHIHAVPEITYKSIWAQNS